METVSNTPVPPPRAPVKSAPAASNPMNAELITVIGFIYLFNLCSIDFVLFLNPLIAMSRLPSLLAIDFASRFNPEMIEIHSVCLNVPRIQRAVIENIEKKAKNGLDKMSFMPY